MSILHQNMLQLHTRSDGIQGRQVFVPSFALALRMLASKNILDTLLQFQSFFTQTFCAFVFGSIIENYLNRASKFYFRRRIRIFF